tara:strand:- start:552 stop:971 length:420 start_codon:yes stop_codon:yes gene_type:complete
MAEEIKCVINDPKTGKSYSKPVQTSALLNRKIKDKVPGNLVDLIGYELEIKGGSDNSGFPMRPEIDTTQRKKILVKDSIGVKIKRKGMFRRKTVRGNTISEKTAQINLTVSKYGTKPIEGLLTSKENSKEEVKKETKKE